MGLYEDGGAVMEKVLRHVILTAFVGLICGWMLDVSGVGPGLGRPVQVGFMLLTFLSLTVAERTR